jgi:protein ImuB
LKSAFAGPSPGPEPLWRKPQRPPLLFTTPEPLTVLAEIPEGPPARFTWRRVTHRVVKSEGPERIAPEWWRGLVRGAGTQSAPTSPPGGGLEFVASSANTARPRDYYRIEDEDGHRYWVFREGLYQEAELGPPSWYLHGVFG